MKEEIEEIKREWDSDIKTAQAVFDVFGNAVDYFKKATYVQKRKIVQLLFLNIQVSDDWRLYIRVRDSLKWLFAEMGRLITLCGIDWE
jgi:hypothetical protein